MRTRETIEKYLADQKPPIENNIGLPVNEETRTRALIGINNTQIVIAELLLDIRDVMVMELWEEETNKK